MERRDWFWVLSLVGSLVCAAILLPFADTCFVCALLAGVLVLYVLLALAMLLLTLSIRTLRGMWRLLSSR